MSNDQRKMRGPMGGPMGGIRAGGEKAKDFKKTMKSLMSYLKPYRLMIIIVIIFAIGSAAFSIVGPKILGRATTTLFEGLVSKVTGQAGAGIDFGYRTNSNSIIGSICDKYYFFIDTRFCNVRNSTKGFL